LSGHGPLVEVLPDGSTVDQIMREVANGEGAITFEAFAAYISKTSPERKASAHSCSEHSSPASKDGQAQNVLIKMMQDLDTIDSKTDWKTPRSQHCRQLSSLLEDGSTGSTVQPSHAVPELHKWLSEICRELDGAAIGKLLRYPAERPEPALVEDSLPAICRHFWAAIYTARLLAEDPMRKPAALRSAVAEALKAHDTRLTRRLAEVRKHGEHRNSKKSEQQPPKLGPDSDGSPQLDAIHAGEMVPGKGHMQMNRHASEPGFLAAAKYSEAMPRSRSEAALPGDPGYANHCLALPKLPKSGALVAAGGISRLPGRGLASKKPHDDPCGQRPVGIWRP